MPRAFYTLLLTLFLALPVSAQQKHADTEKLGMALEYFASGKYHEALLLFQRLDKAYKLNARFRAYIGLCYYHEWEYDKACQYLDELIPQLSALAPHERSVYYYAAAESHFNLQQYEAAIPYYEQVLSRCWAYATTARKATCSTGWGSAICSPNNGQTRATASARLKAITSASATRPTWNRGWHNWQK